MSEAIFFGILYNLFWLYVWFSAILFGLMTIADIIQCKRFAWQIYGPFALSTPILIMFWMF